MGPRLERHLRPENAFEMERPLSMPSASTSDAKKSPN